MIECPWCQNEIEIMNNKCPICKRKLYDVTDTDFNEEDENEYDNNDDISMKDIIMSNFRCNKCQDNDCRVKEVAMTGTGLSKLLDIQHNHFLFVSCNNCGFVEIYDPDVLNEKKSGSLGTILDILFGG